jgi:hypothetical protein
MGEKRRRVEEERKQKRMGRRREGWVRGRMVGKSVI